MAYTSREFGLIEVKQRSKQTPEYESVGIEIWLEWLNGSEA